MLSTELADLFIRLWNSIEQATEAGGAIPPPSALVHGRLEAEAVGLISRPTAAAELEKWSGTDQQRAVIAAQAIDAWFLPMTGPTTGLNSELREARRQYLLRHRFDSAASSDRLILRRPLGGRWQDPLSMPKNYVGAAAFFETLFVLPGEITSTHPDDETKPIKIKIDFRMSAAADVRPFDLTRPWSLGIAPIAEADTDFDFKTLDVAGQEHYDVQVQPLHDRIKDVVKYLCEQNCRVIAFPEMAIHEDAITVLKDAVAAHGPTSQLSLVFAGSARMPDASGKPPYNESIVLDHLGREILKHRKLTHWNLKKDQCDRYALPCKGATLNEYTTAGDTVTVLEHGFFGRIATLICEDLSRFQPGVWLRENMLLDLQFTPILDATIEEQRWPHRFGTKASFSGRCRVIVANSVPLTLRQNKVNNASGATHRVSGQCGIAFLADVESADLRERFVHVPLPLTSPVAEVVSWHPETWNLSSISKH
ncbi:nitrilase-related carbon-nitrogen hydrolase [Dongia sedimenti]|uniref:CN hydrolase domain-containing protein n=1 Tax=Dongia sedimenti TaxID=3064282 RepID=A0ABU0YX71_9PROT|nr:hypothetical protein [Rhodospirillaceae bacterium R-7]